MNASGVGGIQRLRSLSGDLFHPVVPRATFSCRRRGATVPLRVAVAAEEVASRADVAEGRPAVSSFECDGFVDGKFRAYLKVRDVEVGAAGVVDSTTCLQYLYHARCSLFEGIGHPIEQLQLDGVFTATIRMECVFKELLMPKDRMYTEASFLEIKGAKLKMFERLVRLPTDPLEEEVVIAEAITTAVSLSDKYRPIAWPAHIKQAIEDSRSRTS